MLGACASPASDDARDSSRRFICPQSMGSYMILFLVLHQILPQYASLFPRTGSSVGSPSFGVSDVYSGTLLWNPTSINARLRWALVDLGGLFDPDIPVGTHGRVHGDEFWDRSIGAVDRAATSSLIFKVKEPGQQHCAPQDGTSLLAFSMCIVSVPPFSLTSA